MKSGLQEAMYLFNEGTNFDAFDIMQIYYVANDGKKMYRFRVYAPNAKSVSIVGDFNNWDRTVNPMEPVEGGLWQGFIRALKRYDNYKFSIEGMDGTIRMKSDPYATHAETSPGTASKIYDISKFSWSDDKYMTERKTKNHYKSPMNIYEVQLGSFKRHEDGTFLSYQELAKELIPYVLDMGYTHIELMPVTEYPFDGSWGYQATGLYAPTSRHGSPHDFMQFINDCHVAGIGVIMDFVLSHFPKDDFGLIKFDGSPMFEYSDPKKSEHKSWGTMVYDFGKGSVRSFLISAVCFWAEKYHMDGFRLDAVASMLYLDYDRKKDEWTPNKYGGNYNLEAIDFLRQLNTAVLTRNPDVIMIAEESTAFPMVTMPPSVGGLGFNFKWNMGFMNDILVYIRTDAFFRKGVHNKLTFSLTYAFSENYILPFSHDEVVHGKASMIGKMPGDYKTKFCDLKTLYAFQFAHPGKKLNFMGNEFGQFIEWDFKKGLDWLLLDYEQHRKLKAFSKALNNLYKSIPALYQQDGTYDGFKWLVVDDSIQNVVAFYREDEEKNRVIVIINFSEVKRDGYVIGVPDAGSYGILLNSKAEAFGEKTAFTDKTVFDTTPTESHGQPQSITVNIEGHSALFLGLKAQKGTCRVSK